MYKSSVLAFKLYIHSLSVRDSAHNSRDSTHFSPSVFTQCWEDITYESICQQEVYVAVQGNNRS